MQNETTMTQFLKSDLFRSFAGGFVLGTIMLFSMQPAGAFEELGAKVQSLYAAPSDSGKTA